MVMASCLQKSSRKVSRQSTISSTVKILRKIRSLIKKESRAPSIPLTNTRKWLRTWTETGTVSSHGMSSLQRQSTKLHFWTNKILGLHLECSMKMEMARLQEKSWRSGFKLVKIKTLRTLKRRCGIKSCSKLMKIDAGQSHGLNSKTQWPRYLKTSWILSRSKSL